MNKITLFIVLTALLLSACASATPTPGSANNELQGSSWVLQSLDGNDQVGAAIGGQPVTLTFADGARIEGSGSCNGFGGDYETNASVDTVGFSNIVSTLMACEAEGVGEVESSYFEALGQVTKYSMAGDMLTLTGGGHTLVFVRA